MTTTLTLPAFNSGEMRFAALDLRDFCSRLDKFYTQMRRTRRARAKKDRYNRKKTRWFRKHSPQNEATVERADVLRTTDKPGHLYFTLSNGQVLRSGRALVRPGYNPVLRDKVIAYVTAAEQTTSSP